MAKAMSRGFYERATHVPSFAGREPGKTRQLFWIEQHTAKDRGIPFRNQLSLYRVPGFRLHRYPSALWCFLRFRPRLLN